LRRCCLEGPCTKMDDEIKELEDRPYPFRAGAF
jgi:hypothetical protein